MNKRLGPLKRKHLLDTTKIDIRPRNKALLAIEGWYNTDIDYSILPLNIRKLYDVYLESGSGLKFTRWLTRNEFVSVVDCAKLGTLLKPVSFKISCRHNDLLRLADTNHYKSCLASWRSAQQLRYLADPDIAVIFVPDSSGKFKWRALVRLMKNVETNETCFVLYREYGNANTSLIYKELNKLYPLFFAQRKVLYDVETGITLPAIREVVGFESLTIYNNKIVGDHVWSDHSCHLAANKLHMFGHKFINERG